MKTRVTEMVYLPKKLTFYSTPFWSSSADPVTSLITVACVLYGMKEIDRRILEHFQKATISHNCDGTVNIFQLFEEYDLKIRRYMVTKVHKNENGHWIRSIVVKTYVPPYISIKKMAGEVAQKEGVLSCVCR